MITKTEIKELCELVRAYCKGEITKEEFWEKRDSYFKQEDLFEGRTKI